MFLPKILKKFNKFRNLNTFEFLLMEIIFKRVYASKKLLYISAICVRTTEYN